MKLLIDMEMSYRGYHGCPSKCGVTIYEPTTREEGYVAVYTELDTNAGTSVTNAAESIATGIWEFLERPEQPITFIEHYRDRAFVAGKPLYKEQFDLVTFTPVKAGFAAPRWRRISKEEVDRITRPFDIIT